jgi:hypothetical protein
VNCYNAKPALKRTSKRLEKRSSRIVEHPKLTGSSSSRSLLKKLSFRIRGSSERSFDISKERAENLRLKSLVSSLQKSIEKIAKENEMESGKHVDMELQIEELNQEYQALQAAIDKYST